jgi:hypothetical protein
MEATFVLVLFLTLLFGGMTLALAMGYQSIEESRAQQARDSKARTARPVVGATVVPGFLARVDDHKLPSPLIAFDDALLAELEEHVRAEQAVVKQFVHFPSIDSLYRHSGSSLRIH